MPPMTTERGPRVAYLVSLYPAVSHSFVQREIAALRTRGVRVDPFSIHRSTESDVLTDADRASRDETFAVVPPRMPDFVAAHLRQLLARPGTYLQTLGRALRMPGGRRRGRLSQLFHFAEAVPIADQCRRRGILHVHAHFTSPSADVALLVAALLGPRAVWSFTAHGTDIFDDVPARLAAKVHDAALVVCVSDFGRSQLMRLVAEEHWPKLRVVRCGLDRPWFAPCPLRPADGAALSVLSVGRLEREKGHTILIDAIADLAGRGVAARLVVVGDGSRRPALEQQARRLGVAESVAFVGSIGQDRIRERYLDADVFCLPSLGEGIPIVLMEAMATGLPAVASRVMGIPELVEDGVTGLLVSPARPDETADALQRLASDAGIRTRMGAAGRRKVIADHHAERSAEALHEAFTDLAQRGATA